ncbi:S9 family peptidase [Uliginosibacterium sp. 31-12]|uniref:S9 family peptidase n=1 Tax=Uliginosibacterium sp. 31-12 TaxID=3062781 RepID=UPI0026E3ED87|nr:S9 family peptidase [Uliginosibacterium sp. 31-12]MDO6385015.1 S9 family peptidase [Uliginosibacterium sp. 31-12]
MSKLDLSPTPPNAAKRAKKLLAHGHVRLDPFHWLRKVKSQEVLDYLRAENAYAEAVLAPTQAAQEALYTELLSRIQEADLSVPVKFGSWMYYSRTVQGAQYPVHARKRITSTGWEDAPEEILLDENLEAAGKSFYEVGDYELSPSGRYLAWTEDTRGQRSYRLRVRDLVSGRNLRLSHKGVVSLAWAEDENADGATLFFVTEDAKTKRACSLWRQHLQDKAPTPLHEERDERFNLLVFKTRSRGLIVASSTSHTTSEARILPASQPRGRWRLVQRRRAGVEYEVDHHSDHLYLRSNDAGQNFRLLRAPLARWHGHWEEVLALREEVILEGVDLYQDWLIASERCAGLPQLSLTHLPSAKTHQIAFSDPAYVVDLEDLPEWDAPILRYTYESLTTPDSLFAYDPSSRTSTLLKRQPVLGGFDPANYASARIHAMATDGAQIPISLVWHKATQLDGSAPLWLDGYGAYGISNDPWFSATRLSLLDRGWIFAIAHVRGGGDLGQRWHEAGKLEEKKNSFSDYLACAETLIAQGFTSKGKILANGGSAGGLLVGAALNMAPGLFGAAILEVPFLDVVTTMLDPSLPLTVGEYEEWGNPERRADYRRMLAYSPYDNLQARAYPPILIEAGLHDSQVMIWEPAKYVAKLRTLKTDHNPLLFLTSMEAGHGGASGRYDALHERARQLAFALATLAPASLPESTLP